MGTTRDIAEFACKTTIDDFDSGLVKHIKNVLLSGVGMTMAGVNTPAGEAVVSYIKEYATVEEAGVLGAGFRTLAEYAALANGTLSHSTELEDDTFPEGIYSVGIFPGILALGEKLHVSGKEVIEAFVIAWGREIPISIRLKDGTEYKKVCPKATDPIIVSDEEVMDKYMKCALRVLSRNRAEQIAEIILTLEKVQDISELMTLCTFPDKYDK